jgi:ribosomal protein S18 acetylase RimI-like enzyme
MENQKISIRKAELNDVPVLEKISVDTFTETFAAHNTREDMDLFLKECFNAEAIAAELKDINTGYYLAYFEEELAGYIKIRYGSHEGLTAQIALEIARIYVYELFQSKKIGAALMQYAFDIAKSKNAEAIWLGVWEKNPKAIEFYKRWGFEIFGQHVFKLGTDDQNDLLMCKYLNGK